MVVRRVMFQGLVGIAPLMLLACNTGTIESPLPSGWDTGMASPNGSPFGGAGPVAPGGKGATAGGATAAGAGMPCATRAVGPSPMRRLTRDEYNNSVAELLGDTSAPADAFAPDTQVGIFDNSAEAQTVPVLLAEQYLDAAEQAARNVTDIRALVGCDVAGAMGKSCVQAFITRFGRRVYRRPLTSEETSGMLGVFTQVSSASDPQTGVRGVLTALLSSPNFIFRPEFGGGVSSVAGAKQAGSYELAARLASLLWASAPDDMLLDAAASGKLASPADVASQARRMLFDPRSHAALRSFYEQWLGLPLLESAAKDTTAYPLWDEELRASMYEETRRFIDHVLWEDDALLRTLFTADYSFLNGELAKLYGLPAPRDANAYARTQLDARQRSGVLTQPSLMAVFASPAASSPIKRGKLVRVRLLCQDLRDPPANVPPPPEPKQGVSTRERFAMHTASPACSSCHSLIDGLGFGLEHYDGIGAYRDVDQGVPVDASGLVNATRDIDGPYSGGPELAGRLVEGEDLRDCVPRQWLRYALARRESDEDACSLDSLQRAFARTDGDLYELMVALTQTDAFMNYKQPK
ncbi:MAG TPA: DUF1592 domain-containing protein [Polyangiales bacterium]|nr:DUF1592 domain-containing protein [Polyangiales bacterium]